MDIRKNAVVRSGLGRKRSRDISEKLIEFCLFGAALVSVVVTFGIVFILVSQSLLFFAQVPFKDFLLDPEWAPLFENAHFGIRPLLSATLTTSAVALSVAVPCGTVIAIFLSEFASHRFREFAKPLLELLGGVPTIVYGYFALLFVTPWLQYFFPNLPGFSMLSAGLVMGLSILPYISSLAEDAMRSVPMSLREGSYGMGATRFQTAVRVVFPAALSGIASAYILAISRAVGETMIVAVAAGMQPGLSFNPTNPGETVSAYIVQVAMGDLPHGSLGYQTIFAAGLTLMVMTLAFNIGGHFLRKRFREVY